MKSYPTKFKSFQRRTVQMGALQELQNSIQTLMHQSIETTAPRAPGNSEEFCIYPVLKDGLKAPYSWDIRTPV